MHKPYPDTTDDSGQLIRGRSALHQALDVAHQIQRAKVLSGPDDSVGLLLYNVDVGFRLVDFSDKHSHPP